MPEVVEESGDALTTAAALGDLRELRRLLEEGADIDAPDRRGVRPVVAAARYGRREAVGLLLDKGANPGRLAEEDDALLCLVAAWGWPDLVLRLLDTGVSVETRSSSDHTALHLAAMADSPAWDNRTQEKRERDCAAVIRLLIARGLNPNVTATRNAMTPLAGAAWHGATECVRELLAEGANVNGSAECVYTPLYLAAAWHHVAIVQMLLKAGVDVNRRQTLTGETPLIAALQTNAHSKTGPQIARLLLEYGAYPLASKGKRTALHEAARHGTADIVHELIVRGALVQAQDSTGTPLHDAAASGCADCAKLLLQAGADPNAATRTGGTPLYEAGIRGNFAVAQVLVAHGARADVPDPKRGKPLLFGVVDAGTPELCELLLTAGADPNTFNKQGRTPLHYAAMNGKTAAVRVLLAGGADPAIRDHNGQTPLDLARARKRKPIVALLEKIL